MGGVRARNGTHDGAPAVFGKRKRHRKRGIGAFKQQGGVLFVQTIGAVQRKVLAELRGIHTEDFPIIQEQDQFVFDVVYVFISDIRPAEVIQRLRDACLFLRVEAKQDVVQQKRGLRAQRSVAAHDKIQTVKVRRQLGQSKGIGDPLRHAGGSVACDLGILCAPQGLERGVAHHPAFVFKTQRDFDPVIGHHAQVAADGKTFPFLGKGKRQCGNAVAVIVERKMIVSIRNGIGCGKLIRNVVVARVEAKRRRAVVLFPHGQRRGGVLPCRTGKLLNAPTRGDAPFRIVDDGFAFGAAKERDRNLFTLDIIDLLVLIVRARRAEINGASGIRRIFACGKRGEVHPVRRILTTAVICRYDHLVCGGLVCLQTRAHGLVRIHGNVTVGIVYAVTERFDGDGVGADHVGERGGSCLCKPAVVIRDGVPGGVVHRAPRESLAVDPIGL